MGNLLSPVSHNERIKFDSTIEQTPIISVSRRGETGTHQEERVKKIKINTSSLSSIPSIDSRTPRTPRKSSSYLEAEKSHKAAKRKRKNSDSKEKKKKKKKRKHSKKSRLKNQISLRKPLKRSKTIHNKLVHRPLHSQNSDNFIGNEFELNQKHSGLRKLRTNHSLIEYFGDEQADDKKMLKIKNPYFYHEHTVNFSLSVYFEMFFLHILYNTFLGPFIVFFTICTKNKYLAYNLQFLRNSIGCYIHFFQWIFSLLILYHFFFNKTCHFGDYNDIYILVFSYIIRSSSIAGKYATYPDNLMRKVKEKRISLNEIKRELMLRGWMVQSDDIVETEIDNALKRKEIDDSIFRLGFMTNLNGNTEKRLFELSMKFNKIKMLNFEDYQCRECSKKTIIYYDSKLIFRFLIEEFNSKCMTLRRRKYIVSIIAAIFYSSIAGILRVTHGQTFHGNSASTIITFYCNYINLVFITIVMILGYCVAIFDMKRKAYMLHQLGLMISPKKRPEYKVRKLLPTVNLLDQLTLNTWIELRKLVTDYGRKFFFRHEIFLPIILICGTSSLVFAVMLGLYSGERDEAQHIEFEKFIIFLTINFFLLFFVFFSMIFSASNINKQFNSHIKILKENKQLYLDLLFFKEFYFSDSMTEQKKSKTGRYKFDAMGLQNIKSTSYVHRRLAKEVKDILGPFVNDFVGEYLENVIRVNDSCIEELEDEQRFNSLRLLGFRITNQTVMNLIIAFLSVSATGYEILYNK